MSAFLTRDMRPYTACTIARACLSAEEEPASVSKACVADVIAMELEVEQSVQQKNSDKYLRPMHHTPSQKYIS